MANTIGEYYSDELVEWSNAIAFYKRALIVFEDKLGEVIRRNSIAGIAKKVEAHQTLINNLKDRFYLLQLDIHKQAEELKIKGMSMDDEEFYNSLLKRQIKIRQQMQTAEKEYIDVKFKCYSFFTDTLKK